MGTNVLTARKHRQAERLKTQRGATMLLYKVCIDVFIVVVMFKTAAALCVLYAPRFRKRAVKFVFSSAIQTLFASTEGPKSNTT